MFGIGWMGMCLLRSFPNGNAPPWLVTVKRFNDRMIPLSSRSSIDMEGGNRRGRGEEVDTRSSHNHSSINSSSNPPTKVNLIQQLVNNDPTGGWDKCWEQAVTPWDLGGPTPLILNLLQKDDLPKGRVLVPGCGSGHDVVAISGPERYVVGLDVSENAIKKARELFPSSQNTDHYTFIMEDFFNWNPPSLFDLIFDYTFFCAIEPSMRPAWASRISDLLKPDGELITLMFPIDDRIGGPPYKVSLADYEQVLHPMGFKASCVMDNELAIGARKGKEKLGRWNKCVKQAHL